MLIQDGRKFHIRSNISVVEKLWNQDLLDVYIHNRHEVRIAGQPVTDSLSEDRDPLAHITNGVSSDTTQRALLSSIPELAALESELQVFLAKAFQSFMPDITRRVGYSASHDVSGVNIRKFAIAGVDLMVTESGRFYLLEVNVNPAAPPEELVEAEFKQHLIGWMTDLVDLVMGRKCPNFININHLLPSSSDAEGVKETFSSM